MASLTTHVLDQVTGAPAIGLQVVLSNAATSRELVAERTDDDGRARLSDELSPGTYLLRFATGPWFTEQSQPAFYPLVAIYFDMTSAVDHYHVPLLLSPFGYSTYRGS